MIIDVHVHIFPGRIRENKAAFFQNEPAFELLYGSDASMMASTAVAHLGAFTPLFYFVSLMPLYVSENGKPK